MDSYPPPRPALGLPAPSTAILGHSGCDATEHAPSPSFEASEAVDSEPEAVRKVSPYYPDAAREANVDGVVQMKVLVCEHGRVLDARVTSRASALDQAALDSVGQWTFTPAMRGGKPVPRWTSVPMRFTLN